MSEVQVAINYFIPEEIWTIILKHFHSTLFFYKLRRVCKSWKKIIDNLIQSFSIQLESRIENCDLKWKKISVKKENPFLSEISNRQTHSSVVVGKNLFLFGGKRTNSEDEDGKLFILDLETFIWEVIRPSSDSPFPRGFSSLVYCPDNHSLFLFGGQRLTGNWRNRSEDRTFYNDLYSFSLKSLTWKRIHPKNEPPCARVGHRACYIKHSITGSKLMYLFGGTYMQPTNEYVYLNDIWTFDIDELIWTRIQTTGLIPSTRHSPSFQVINNSRIFLFGGNCDVHNHSHFDDVYYFITENNEWKSLDTTGNKPSKGWCYQIEAVNQKYVILFSGLTLIERGVPIHALNLETLIWKKILGSGDIPNFEKYIFPTLNYIPFKNSFIVVGGVDDEDIDFNFYLLM